MPLTTSTPDGKKLTDHAKTVKDIDSTLPLTGVFISLWDVLRGFVRGNGGGWGGRISHPVLLM